MLIIDGTSYDVRVDVERTAEMTASQISGLMLDRSYFNDVLGTYLSYALTFTYPLYDRSKYTAIFEVLTAPVDGHSFVLPYNEGTVTVTARVASVSDQLIQPEGGRDYWKSTKFTIVANHPTKALTLGEAIERGRPPLPEVARPAPGVLYTYTAEGWVAVEYPDAENIYY